ncbi:MAG: IS30 family transposase [Chthoniobacteraceae bacterium]
MNCPLAGLHAAGWGDQKIGEYLGRSQTTIWRERRRNRAPYDGLYRAERAQERAVARRWRSRRNGRMGAGQWERAEELLGEKWSPEQMAGYFRKTGEMKISHERIYQQVWKDRERGGKLWEHLRGARKQRRKRYGRKDSRGRLAGKRPIGERPAVVEKRGRVGDWEIDTVHGSGKACVVTVVERKSGYVLIAKLEACTVEETNGRTHSLMKRHPGKFLTITGDNGTEFHGYAELEKGRGVKFYFATPHHAWERGTNENTNGLIRQYLPKRQSMAELSQKECEAIAKKLNNRPRKRHAYKTPNECFHSY